MARKASEPTPDPPKRPGWARIAVEVHVDDLDALERKLDHAGNGTVLTERIERSVRRELRGAAVRGMQVTVVPDPG